MNCEFAVDISYAESCSDSPLLDCYTICYAEEESQVLYFDYCIIKIVIKKGKTFMF